MKKRIAKAVAASIMATTLLSTTVATVVPMSVSAGEVLGETTFDYKALPWHTCETNPAKQTFELTEDGTFHITVTKPLGGESSKWDLQFRHRNLNFKAGHTYEVSFDVKAKRDGMELCSKIGNMKGDEEYFLLDGNAGNMHMGPHMGGQWGSAASLSTSWKTYSGTFTPTSDLEAVEWAFHYAEDHNGYGGNAQVGDELWFDNMHIIDKTSDELEEIKSYGRTSRDWSPELGTMTTGKDTVNFISVNQVGYYSNLSKIATLGDNAGDVLKDKNLPEPTKIDIGTSPLDYEIKDAKTGEVVKEGKTEPKGMDKDSGDNCHIIDFTDFTTPGRYYIQIKGKDWRSYEFNIGDNIYSDTSHNMLTNALNYFYQNRSGVDIKSEYITSGDKTTLAHEGGHKTDTAIVQKEWVISYSPLDGKTKPPYTDPPFSEAATKYKSSEITASGGWYDAGDHGKYVVNGGISVWTLQNMYERSVVQGDASKWDDGSGTVVVPETGNSVPDILDEAAVELDWMMDMVVKSDEPTWGKYAGLVYHKLHDHKWTGLATKPYDYVTEWGCDRIVKPPTYTATLNFVACAAQAARLWQDIDSAKANKYLEAAKKSYAAYKEFYKPHDGTDKNPLWPPLDQAIGGGAYGDTKSTDDAYWAACELYATTGDSTYYDDLSKYEDAFDVVTYIKGGENQGSFGSFNWGNTASAGSLTLYLNKDNSKLTNLTDANKNQIISTIQSAADAYVAKEADQAYGIPYEGTTYTDPVNLPADLEIDGFEWGSNSFVVNNAIIMAYAYDETKDIKYMNGVTTAMDYIFGRNPMAYSYVTGYGTYHLVGPHHRYWSYELDKTLPLAPDGVMSGGANAGLQDPYIRALGFVPGDPDNPSERCYVDSIEAWSANEVTINWNSPFAWVVSFLQDEAADATDSGLKVTPSSVTVKVDETKKLDVTVDGKPASGATFSSSDESVAKVSSDGTVTGVSEGKATITVTVGDQTKTVTVTVTDESQSSSDPSNTGDTKPTTSGEQLTTYTGSKDDLIYGDANLDEDVGAADVATIVKYMLDKNAYPLGKGDAASTAKAEEQSNVANYDEHKIDSADVSWLQSYVLTNITKDKLGPQK